jgi:uncharacterized Zn-finger protein
MDDATKVSPKFIICEYCGKQYSTIYTLNRHIKTICKVAKITIEPPQQIAARAEVQPAAINTINNNTTINSNDTINNTTINNIIIVNNGFPFKCIQPRVANDYPQVNITENMIRAFLKKLQPGDIQLVKQKDRAATIRVYSELLSFVYEREENSNILFYEGRTNFVHMLQINLWTSENIVDALNKVGSAVSAELKSRGPYYSRNVTQEMATFIKELADQIMAVKNDPVMKNELNLRLLNAKLIIESGNYDFRMKDALDVEKFDLRCYNNANYHIFNVNDIIFKLKQTINIRDEAKLISSIREEEALHDVEYPGSKYLKFALRCLLEFIYDKPENMSFLPMNDECLLYDNRNWVQMPLSEGLERHTREVLKILSVILNSREAEYFYHLGKHLDLLFEHQIKHTVNSEHTIDIYRKYIGYNLDHMKTYPKTFPSVATDFYSSVVRKK